MRGYANTLAVVEWTKVPERFWKPKILWIGKTMENHGVLVGCWVRYFYTWSYNIYIYICIYIYFMPINGLMATRNKRDKWVSPWFHRVFFHPTCLVHFEGCLDWVVLCVCACLVYSLGKPVYIKCLKRKRFAKASFFDVMWIFRGVNIYLCIHKCSTMKVKANMKQISIWYDDFYWNCFRPF